MRGGRNEDEEIGKKEVEMESLKRCISTRDEGAVDDERKLVWEDSEQIE